MSDYLHLLRDPAHWMFELTLITIIDGLLIGLGWRWFTRRWVAKHDREAHSED